MRPAPPTAPVPAHTAANAATTAATAINVLELVSASIAGITPYEPGKPIEEVEREMGEALPPGGTIKLASNENPLGPSPRALEAVQASLGRLNLYPDGGCFFLKRRLADFHARHGVSESELAIGNGSNELLTLLVQTFTEPGHEVLAPAHSFLCYRLAAQAAGAIYREVPRGPGFAFDVDAILDGVTPRTRVVFLANPDNPTGVYANRDAVLRLVRELPPRVLLVLDEAYLEYASAADFPDGLAMRGERQLLALLRTFSKAYGLAGLRCGYAVAPREVVQLVDRVRAPFNVSSLAQVAARAALDDEEHLARARAVNRVGMLLVRAELERLGLRTTPSQANFVLVDLDGRDGRALFQALLRRGVIVRPMNGYGLPHHLRVTIGTPAENRRFLDELAGLLGAG